MYILRIFSGAKIAVEYRVPARSDLYCIKVKAIKHCGYMFKHSTHYPLERNPGRCRRKAIDLKGNSVACLGKSRYEAIVDMRDVGIVVKPYFHISTEYA